MRIYLRGFPVNMANNGLQDGSSIPERIARVINVCLQLYGVIPGLPISSINSRQSRFAKFGALLSCPSYTSISMDAPSEMAFARIFR